MDQRQQLHKLVNDLDDAEANVRLHAEADNLDDESLQAALRCIRALRNRFAALARPETLHSLIAALMSAAGYLTGGLSDVLPAATLLV